MSLALLFPGQGTQHPSMLAWIDACPEAQTTLAELAARLGGDWRARLQDPDWATSNAVAQSLLTGLGLAAWQCVADRVPAPSVVAGYSVGELAAFSVAGVFDAQRALWLSHERAASMQRAVAGIDTGLLAVTGGSDAAIAEVCLSHGLTVAIELSVDRRVLGGLASGLDRAALELARRGSRCQRLAVRLASHTPWMQAAVDEFAQRTAALPLATPTPTLVCNLTGGAVSREPALRSALLEQLARPVRWSRCMESIAERAPRCVLEVGAGHTLSDLWNQSFPNVPARSLDEFRSPGAAAAWVGGVLAGR